MTLISTGAGMCLICFVSAVAFSAVDRYGEKRCLAEANSSSTRTVCSKTTFQSSFKRNQIESFQTFLLSEHLSYSLDFQTDIV